MKKYVLVLVLSVLLSPLYAQIDVSGGMGINFVSQSSMKDYINSEWGAQSGNKIGTFTTSVEFFGEVVYSFNPAFQLGLEYANGLYSYNTSFSGISYDISYNLHKPSVVAYYVIPGMGYKFRIGGGLGARIGSITEKINLERDYSAAGWGLLGRLEGNTSLGGNVYAYIAGDIRYDLPGDIKDGDTYLGENTGETVNLNQLAFGIKLGISYFF